MKKLLEFFSVDSRIEHKNNKLKNYNYTLITIIDDVIKKRKSLHHKYDKLIEKVWVSARPLNCKTFLAKYLLTRLLRESDRVFFKAQILATKLCPKCNEYPNNLKNVHYEFSDKTH